MTLFAPGGDGGAGLGGGKAGGDRSAMRRVGAREHQIAPDAVPHDEARIRGERVVHQVHGVEVNFR